MMFEPFQSSGRVEGLTAALGLGLSVSKRLAELMGGRLSYEHADGWSTFELELPSASSVPAQRAV
jgi:signal transduction histidine kinase